MEPEARKCAKPGIKSKFNYRRLDLAFRKYLTKAQARGKDDQSAHFVSSSFYKYLASAARPNSGFDCRNAQANSTRRSRRPASRSPETRPACRLPGSARG